MGRFCCVLLIEILGERHRQEENLAKESAKFSHRILETARKARRHGGKLRFPQQLYEIGVYDMRLIGSTFKNNNVIKWMVKKSFVEKNRMLRPIQENADGRNDDEDDQNNQGN